MKSTELIERDFFEIIKEEFVFPWLNKPIEKLFDYLVECRDIFALVGVFGALAVYSRTAIQNSGITNGDGSFYMNFAIGSGFSIVILLSIVVLVRLIQSAKSAPEWVSWENWGLWAFSVFYIPLVLVVAGITSRLGTFWGLYGFILVYIGPFMMVLATILTISFLNEIVEDKTDFGHLGAAVMTLLSIIVLWVIGKYGIPSQPSTAFGQYSPEDWLVLFEIFLKGFSGLISTIFLVASASLLLIGVAIRTAGAIYDRIFARKIR